MYIKQQLCAKQGHQQFKLTHICIFMDCKTRFICDQCINDYGLYHHHDYGTIYLMEIENFKQYFKDQRLPQIELRLKSQYGNQAKLNYLTKIIEQDFDDDEICNIKYMIQDLINDHQNEVVQAQQLNDLKQQFDLQGLESLNFEQINILLNNQSKFIEKEMEHYRGINIYLNAFDMEYDNLDFQQDQELQNYEKQRKLSKKLKILNHYLDYQHTIYGKHLIIHDEEFLNLSFFSENNRYFAMINCQPHRNNNNKLKVRKQTTLGITQQLNINNPVDNIKFDPLFKYCVILDHQTVKNFCFYFLSNKQFKLIQKFNIEQFVYNFFLSKLNNIIILYRDSIVIKKLNFIHKCINLIELPNTNFYFYCYGSERNIIAINDYEKIKIYHETQRQRQPFISSYVGQAFSEMMFINNDQQLLTQDNKYNMQLWQLDYYKSEINQINKIELQHNSQYYLINTTYVHIIQSTARLSDRCLEIQILDKDFKLWFSFQIYDFQRNDCKSIQLTKNIIAISYYDKEGTQVIKRRQITDYEGLNDY